MDREEAAEKFQEDDENSDGKITFEELVHKQFGYTQDDLKDLNDKEEEDKDVLEVPARLSLLPLYYLLIVVRLNLLNYLAFSHAP